MDHFSMPLSAASPSSCSGRSTDSHVKVHWRHFRIFSD